MNALERVALRIRHTRAVQLVAETEDELERWALLYEVLAPCSRLAEISRLAAEVELERRERQACRKTAA